MRAHRCRIEACPSGTWSSYAQASRHSAAGTSTPPSLRTTRVAEWCTAEDEPDSRTYTGLAELRAFVAHLADPWTDRFGQAIHFEDFIDCGDWVVAPWSGRLHGHGSGIEIEVSETYAVRVRDGRIVRVDEYRTVEEALDAVNGPQT